MADYPAISQDLNDPLPVVDPSSDLVPYRTASSAPGQPQQVTTGYAQRARPPIQPPEGFGGGVGVPNLDSTYQAAFSQLPVDEAVKAVDAATRYIGQRGYQKDLASGMNAAQAFAKWGPTLFKQATGVPEAIERSVPPPITPQQMISNRLNQAKFDAAQAAQKAKLDEAKARQALAARKVHVLSTGAVLQETGNPNDPVKVVREPPPKEDSITETYKVPAVEGVEAQPASKGFLGIGAHPAVEAVAAQPERTIRKTVKTTPNPAQQRVKVKSKDGKVGTIPADQLDKALTQGFTQVK